MMTRMRGMRTETDTNTGKMLDLIAILSIVDDFVATARQVGIKKQRERETRSTI